MIAFVLLVIGGINWGLVGVAHFNLVEKILGMGTVTNVVYILVGLSALWEAVTHGKNCRQCASKPAMGQPMA